MTEIKTEDDLKILKKVSNKSNIIFAFDNLSKSENTMWHDKITKDVNPCGCEIGAKISFFSLLLVALYLIIATLQDTFISKNNWIISIFFVLFSIIFGKIFGIFYSNWRLKRNINRLLKILND